MEGSVFDDCVNQNRENSTTTLKSFVIPAKAGIQLFLNLRRLLSLHA